MRRLKTGSWRPPPVSKNDLGVGTPLVAAERASDSSFCRGSPFSLPLGVSAYFNNYFDSIQFFRFIYSLQVFTDKVEFFLIF